MVKSGHFNCLRTEQGWIRLFLHWFDFFLVIPWTCSEHVHFLWPEHTSWFQLVSAAFCLDLWAGRHRSGCAHLFQVEEDTSLRWAATLCTRTNTWSHSLWWTKCHQVLSWVRRHPTFFSPAQSQSGRERPRQPTTFLTAGGLTGGCFRKVLAAMYPQYKSPYPYGPVPYGGAAPQGGAAPYWTDQGSSSSFFSVYTPPPLWFFSHLYSELFIFFDFDFHFKLQARHSIEMYLRLLLSIIFILV